MLESPFAELYSQRMPQPVSGVSSQCEGYTGPQPRTGMYKGTQEVYHPIFA
jgi:hypothetical protein